MKCTWKISRLKRPPSRGRPEQKRWAGREEANSSLRGTCIQILQESARLSAQKPAPCENYRFPKRYLYKLYHSKLTKMPRTDSEHWQKVHVLVLLRLA